MHPLVELARRTVWEYASEGRTTELTPEDMESFPEEFTSKEAGVFVSLKVHGNLRGCIGTFEPITRSIVHEVIRNAVAASSSDPRFPGVEVDELEDIDYSVDVLTSPEPVVSMDELDPERFGVIVINGHRRGLLLPDLDGVDTIKEQLSIAMSKAGIDPEEEGSKIMKFEVRRYR